MSGISEEERQRRQEWADFALANVELEGFRVDAATRDRMRRYVAGEITLAELVDIRHYQRARYSLGELLAQCDSSADVPAEDREWNNVKPTGSELL